MITTVKCAREGCSDSQTGKSKYCAPHRDAARQAWIEMIASKEDKTAREAKWSALHKAADKAGQEAAEAAKPQAMVVEQHEHPFDDNSPVKQSWYVAEGVCGFAWVTVKPANSSFALWLKKNGHAKNAYQGGVSIWVRNYGQSMQRKEAYAQAYANVVREAGVKAYAQSRMD